jgi:V/A-type H+/Na+-transporting ATPase subunit F
MRFVCVGDADTAAGFRLAGIEARVAEDADEARKAVEEMAERHDCGIIIITEGIADGVRPEIERLRLERERPLIVEIPGQGGPLTGRRSLRQFVQEAVGISITHEGA